MKKACPQHWYQGGESVLHKDNIKHNEFKSHLNLQSYNLLHNPHIRFTLLSCDIMTYILKHFTTIHKG